MLCKDSLRFIAKSRQTLISYLLDFGVKKFVPSGRHGRNSSKFALQETIKYKSATSGFPAGIESPVKRFSDQGFRCDRVRKYRFKSSSVAPIYHKPDNSRKICSVCLAKGRRYSRAPFVLDPPRFPTSLDCRYLPLVIRSLARCDKWKYQAQ